MSEEKMPISLYRKGELGYALEQSLRELNAEGKIGAPLIDTIMQEFDKVICEELDKLNHKSKCTIKGKVYSFRNCDQIWIYYVKNLNINHERGQYTSNNIKIVACNEELRKKDKAKLYGTHS